MNTIEIKDDEINVEEIMRQIRENIKKRRESGAYTKEMEEIISEPLQAPPAGAVQVQYDLQPDLDYINRNYDLHAEYHISSHRRVLGRFLVWGRRLVHGEVRRYVDLLAGKQSEFNAGVVRVLNSSNKTRDSKINEAVAAVNRNVDAKVNEAVVAVNKDVDAKVNEAVAAVNKDVDAKVNGAVAAINRDIDAKVNEAIAAVNKDVDAKVNGAVAAINRDVDAKMNEAVAAVNRDVDAKVNEAVAAVNKDADAKVNEAVAAVNKDADAKVNEAVAAVNRDIDTKVNEAVAAVNNDIKNKAWLANLLDKRIKRNITKLKPPSEEQTDKVMNYFVFEEKFRGSTEDIKQRQIIFVEYFKNCQNVLDIGCGRGEFLSLLKENGIGAKGIDINQDMVLYCQKNGLDVQKAEALGYLASLEDKSLDGVFSAQVVEHLQPEEMISMIKLCYDKMKYGTYFVAETINPLCLGVFSTNFYMDLSHNKPIHPETIRFLLESIGFREIQFNFFSPFPEEAKLRNMELTDLPEKLKKEFEVLNQNISKLNDMVYGFRDYAIVGKK